MGESRSIMLELREKTRPHHEAAEHTAFQQALASGRLPLDTYADSLGQLLLIHARLESHLRQLRKTNAAVRRIIRDEHFQETNLRRDLQAIGRDPSNITSAAATGEMCEAIDRLAHEDPLALLGMHYVMEGSKNGAKFLAPRVRLAYGFADGQGTLYLDPYGDLQRPVWTQFKSDMDGAAFDARQGDAIVAAAKGMFIGITLLYEELYSGVTHTRHSQSA